MKITIENSILEFNEEMSVFEIIKSFDAEKTKSLLGAVINGKTVGTSFVVKEDSTIELLTFNEDLGRKLFRHTASHILAQAVKRLYPDTKLAIGPAIDNGFYYDFDFVKAINQEDLAKIEKEMQNIVKENIILERFVLSKDDAIKLMEEKGEIYKVELINDLADGEEISFYKQGEFVDLCAGAHLRSTGAIKAFKLTSITGAYWKGSEKNKMLCRIYGTAFTKKSDLTEYLEAIEQAKLRDHNKIGRELNLFMTDETIGQGLPLLMPKGAKVIQILERFVEDEEEKRGYLLTKTPSMAKSDLYKISGHWYHYRDGMFVLGDENKDAEVFALRPMTCPFQYKIYNNGLKSYRDLPVRYGETATLFRNESSGEMHGLIRVRQFTLSDGHIVCTPAQLEEEFRGVMDLIYFILDAIGLREDVTFRFSKWDKNNKEKYIDNPILWEKTQDNMRIILNNLGVKFKEADGEAAFYGPKLDVQIKNVHGKEDTIITVQIDFALAERFEMSYIDENGEKKIPFIIHRSSIGCYERTLALLIEKYAGALPTWLSPTQVKVISLTDRNIESAKQLANTLRKAGVRVEIDARSETIGYKIRSAQMEKIPYMAIIGDKEAEEGVVSVRSRKNGELGKLTASDFTALLRNEIDNYIL